MQRQKSATTALIAINVVIYLLSITGIGTVYQLGIFERAVVDGHQWYRRPHKNPCKRQTLTE